MNYWVGRARIIKVLSAHGYQVVDAGQEVSGKDFLDKIWRQILGVPLGIALLDSTLPQRTRDNIFYELGLMQALGKETLVVKTSSANVPSDLIRTEYVNLDQGLEAKLAQFMKRLHETGIYFSTLAENVERNPALALDYLRRAYLLTEDASLRERAQKVRDSVGDRAKLSVEWLHAMF